MYVGHPINSRMRDGRKLLILLDPFLRGTLYFAEWSIPLSSVLFLMFIMQENFQSKRRGGSDLAFPPSSTFHQSLFSTLDIRLCKTLGGITFLSRIFAISNLACASVIITSCLLNYFSVIHGSRELINYEFLNSIC